MRLLLVEDDLPLAEALTSLLVSAGYAVDCIHDGATAEALVAAEPFDRVILDLNLPEKDGLSVLRAWTGMNVHIDRAPILGEAPGCPGLFAAVTSSGYTLGPVAGRMTADALLGRERIGADFSIARFG